jgi:hypothetical protein
MARPTELETIERGIMRGKFVRRLFVAVATTTMVMSVWASVTSTAHTTTAAHLSSQGIVIACETGTRMDYLCPPAS